MFQKIHLNKILNLLYLQLQNELKRNDYERKHAIKPIIADPIESTMEIMLIIADIDIYSLLYMIHHKCNNSAYYRQSTHYSDKYI